LRRFPLDATNDVRIFGASNGRLRIISIYLFLSLKFIYYSYFAVATIFPLCMYVSPWYFIPILVMNIEELRKNYANITSFRFASHFRNYIQFRWECNVECNDIYMWHPHVQLRVYGMCIHLELCHAHIFIFDETTEHGFEPPASRCSDFLEIGTIFTTSEHQF